MEAAFRGDLTKDWRQKNLSSISAAKKGEGPVGWKLCKLQDIADIQSGLALGKKRKNDANLIEVPYLRVANVQRGHLNLDEIKTIFATEKEISRLLLKDGDILMNEGGDRDKLGRGWVWSAQISPCIHQNHVFRVRLNIPDFPSTFISYYANEFGQDYFFSEGKQTTNLASISKTKISSLPVPVPSVDEAKQIVERIEKALSWLSIVDNEQARALYLLNHLDQAHLTKAFRGELVPQDPNDEPATVLLERIHLDMQGHQKAKQPQKRDGVL